MKTVNSLSGGKTSSYMAVHYPADINIFAIVRVKDPACVWMNGKDENTRQLISDRIGQEFIGTAEMDEVIYTILDLEQMIGSEIKIVTGPTFDEVIDARGGFLPNQMARFCTSEMKIKPIFEYLDSLGILPVQMRIGLRPNEKRRAERILAKATSTGIELMPKRIGKGADGRNKWAEVAYRKVQFPLIDDNINKDHIYSFWDDKPVRFAYRNNCVGCVNRQPLMISHMISKDKRKIEWFAKQEQRTGNTFIKGVTYEHIMKWSQQGILFNDDDFNECDSGFCGL